jgi:hypothetical protein
MKSNLPAGRQGFSGANEGMNLDVTAQRLTFVLFLLLQKKNEKKELSFTRCFLCFSIEHIKIV